MQSIYRNWCHVARRPQHIGTTKTTRCLSISRRYSYKGTGSALRDRRTLVTSSHNVTDTRNPALIPMSEEVPGVPALKAARNLPKPETKITTLDNGVRVATEETYGQVSSLGAFLDAGSVYERNGEWGIGHMMENLAFKTSKHYTTDDINEISERKGMSMGCTITRDAATYRVDTLRGAVGDALHLLGDTILYPEFHDDDVSEAKQVMGFQFMDLQHRPEFLVQENLHLAAYGPDSPFGHPTLAPMENVESLSVDMVQNYRKRLFHSDRLVIAAAGVKHEPFVEEVNGIFGDMRRGRAPENPSEEYIGGSHFSDATQDNGEPLEHTHIAIVFPTVGWTDSQVIPACVLDTLLGGGASFSAGGPGKGMYSRLYREVLSRHAWIERANAFSLQYANVGLMGIYGACEPKAADQLAAIMCGELATVALEGVYEDELMRAKNQLRSSVMMNLESRGVLCEDIGRQVLVRNKRMDPDELCQRINAVSGEDLKKIATDALQRKPTIVGVGNTERVPAYGNIINYFDAYKSKLSGNGQ